MSGSNKAGNAVTIFCFGGWIIGVWSMGLFAYNMGAPIIFSLFTFGMGCIPILFFACAYRSKKRQQESPTIRRYSAEPIVYTGDYSLHTEPKSQNQKKVYMVPSNCPSCGVSIDTEEIDWVGPLQAKCPNCGAAIDAEERTF